MIEFRILGPVEVVRDGRPVSIGGPRQQALLALLLLTPGRQVAADRLSDELWAGEPPSGASISIRSYVSRLRSAIGRETAITAVASGYVLDVAPGAVDASRFEQRLRQGQAALAAGSARRAADRLAGALELWRGPALGGVADDGLLRIEAERLEGLRRVAMEARIDADLALGRATVLVDELEALLAADPYRERLWQQLMLALYRAGRQADALAAYRRARARLAGDLGLEPGAELRRLEAAILRHQVPDLPAESGCADLPAPVTSFVGREAELAEVARLLDEARLVTLTGVGGVGKTRLALEAAARWPAAEPGGGCVVDLSGLADPALVARHVADALGIIPASGKPVVVQLARRLCDADGLLLLDNCEHLRDACADLATRLLAAAPGFRILATSREPLGAPGEVDCPVPPLRAPAPGSGPQAAARSEAVRLFLARARQARPGLTVDAETVELVAAICRDLDGLPLAIELAAAHVKAFTLGQIQLLLADRFRFLVARRGLGAPRHRTLLATMAWSADLLSSAERRLLARLAVFCGGFTLQAVAAVGLDGDESTAVGLLGRLVDASLVVADDRGPAMRYRLLETVRRYAAAFLAAPDDRDPVRVRHADWFLALAEEAEPELTGPRQADWFATLEAEHDNLRTALAHLATGPDAERRLRLTVALFRFWYDRGHLAEGRGWLERALDGSDAVAPGLRRRALTAAAAIALIQGDYAAAHDLSERSLAVAQEAGEPRFIANGLSNLGAIALAAGDSARAARLLESAVALARRIGDERIAALAINNLGDVALTAGDFERAEPLFAESLELFQRRGDTANLARSEFNLGAVALGLGRPAEAELRFLRGLELGYEAGDREDLAWCLLGLAGRDALSGRGERASVLLGASMAVLEQMGACFKPFEQRLHDETVDRILRLVGPVVLERARRAGAVMPLGDAIQSAASKVVADALA